MIKSRCQIPVSTLGMAAAVAGSQSPLRVVRRFILARISGGGGDAAASACHARFAAAAAVSALLSEQPAWEVAQAWGERDSITEKGVLPARRCWALAPAMHAVLASRVSEKHRRTAAGLVEDSWKGRRPSPSCTNS